MRSFLFFLLFSFVALVSAQPTSEDLGVMVAPGTGLSRAYAARQIRWFRFTLNTAVQTKYLDIDTENTVGFGGDNDTMVGVYRSNGTLVAFDDDDGSGVRTALSFGTLAGTRGGLGGEDYNGRDGDLPVGTYYVAVSGYASTHGANFGVNSTSTRTGNIQLNFRTNVGAGTELQPVSYSILQGFYFDGALEALLSSDNFSLSVLNDFDTLVGEIELVASGAPVVNNHVEFLIEAAATRVAILQTISLYNYETNRWDVRSGGYASNTDSNFEIDVQASPGRYRSSSGEMKSRIRWSPVNDESPAQDAWLLSIDNVKWTIDGS